MLQASLKSEGNARATAPGQPEVLLLLNAKLHVVNLTTDSNLQETAKSHRSKVLALSAFHMFVMRNNKSFHAILLFVAMCLL